MLFIALRDWGTNGYLYVHVPSETSAPVKKTLVLGTSGGLRHPGRERADDHAQDALPKLYPRRPRERSRNRSPSRAPSRRRSLFQRVDCKSCQSCPLRPPPFAHLRRFAWQTRHALLARGSPAALERPPTSRWPVLEWGLRDHPWKHPGGLRHQHVTVLGPDVARRRESRRPRALPAIIRRRPE